MKIHLFWIKYLHNTGTKLNTFTGTMNTFQCIHNLNFAAGFSDLHMKILQKKKRQMLWSSIFIRF